MIPTPARDDSRLFDSSSATWSATKLYQIKDFNDSDNNSLILKMTARLVTILLLRFYLKKSLKLEMFGKFLIALMVMEKDYS